MQLIVLLRHAKVGQITLASSLWEYHLYQILWNITSLLKFHNLTSEKKDLSKWTKSTNHTAKCIYWMSIVFEAALKLWHKEFLFQLRCALLPRLWASQQLQASAKKGKDGDQNKAWKCAPRYVDDYAYKRRKSRRRGNNGRKHLQIASQ